ncbi:unnamed protein product, partial [Mesorhabditis spiculigera]
MGATLVLLLFATNIAGVHSWKWKWFPCNGCPTLLLRIVNASYEEGHQRASGDEKYEVQLKEYDLESPNDLFDSCSGNMYENGTTPCVVRALDSEFWGTEFYLKFIMNAVYTGSGTARCTTFGKLEGNWGIGNRDLSGTASLHVFPEEPFCRIDYRLRDSEGKLLTGTKMCESCCRWEYKC